MGHTHEEQRGLVVRIASWDSGTPQLTEGIKLQQAMHQLALRALSFLIEFGFLHDTDYGSSWATSALVESCSVHTVHPWLWFNISDSANPGLPCFHQNFLLFPVWSSSPRTLAHTPLFSHTSHIVVCTTFTIMLFHGMWLFAVTAQWITFLTHAMRIY